MEYERVDYEFDTWRDEHPEEYLAEKQATIDGIRMQRILERPSTVSRATLRPEDILPALLEALKDVDPFEYNQVELDPYTIEDVYDEDSELYEDYNDDANLLMEDISDLISHLCPPGIWFGTLEGDSSHIAFYPSPCGEHRHETHPLPGCPACQANERRFYGD